MLLSYYLIKLLPLFIKVYQVTIHYIHHSHVTLFMLYGFIDMQELPDVIVILFNKASSFIHKGISGNTLCYMRNALKVR